METLREENILILGEKNLIRTARIRGAYISQAAERFLASDTNTILSEWQQRGLYTDNAIRETLNRVYFTVDSKNVFTPQFIEELVAKKGKDWKEFYPDIYSLVEAKPFVERIDEKFRPYLLAMPQLFEEFDKELQSFSNYPSPQVQNAITQCLPRFRALGLEVSFIQFEHRLCLQGGKQIKAEEARVFFQQYTNFREFFLSQHRIPVHALVFHNAPFATGVKAVMNTFAGNFTLWTEDNLSCFPTDHILCPQIRILSPQERKDVYEEQGSDGSKQLLQHASDPLSKIYRLRPGDLVEVTRDLTFLKMPTEKMIAYRYIIN